MKYDIWRKISWHPFFCTIEYKHGSARHVSIFFLSIGMEKANHTHALLRVALIG
jgi:hypothetical protein